MDAILSPDLKSTKPISSPETSPTDVVPSPKDTAPTPPSAPPEQEVTIPEENWKVSPLFYELASYLGVEEKSWEGSADKMSIITEWAIKEAKSNKIHDMLPVIRRLEDKIMKPAWGETRLNNIYRYLRLAMKRDAFDKALSAFETQGGVTK